MRSPLSTIQTTTTYLTALNAGDDVSVAASRLIRSGASMKALPGDLVDFSRTKLGLGINISLTHTDLAGLFADEVTARSDRGETIFSVRLPRRGENLSR